MSAGLLAPDRSLTDSDSSAREWLDRWHAAGIRYCLLRSCHQAEGHTSDVDVLVDESCADRARQFLDQHGFVAGPGRSPFKLVMLRYQDGRLVCFDIHWKATQYGIVYMDAQRMLARRVESSGLFHLSAEDELIHLVVHNFLRKGRLRSSALDAIRHLLQTPLDRRYLSDHLDAFGLRRAFEKAVAWIERKDANSASAAGLRTRLFWAALRSQPGNIGRYLMLRTRVRPIARRRGGLVALVGPDGSGKSTVVRTLTARAKAIPSLKVETTYLGPWGQMKLRLVPTLRRFGITPTVQAPAWLGSIAKGYVFYAAIYIELVYRYATSVFFRVRQGRWVLADRYITDLRYLYKERPIRNYAGIRRLLCMIYPKPDLVIVLDNDPNVIVSRKNQLAAAQIETLRHFCLKAARAYRFEVVTTDRSPEEIADHILNRMLTLRALK